jgi:hypothetical protein
MFCTGDRVVISLLGEEHYRGIGTDKEGSNPFDVEGVVIPAPQYSRRLWVRWDNGITNNYSPEELDLVGPPPTIEECF